MANGIYDFVYLIITLRTSLPTVLTNGPDPTCIGGDTDADEDADDSD